jgi:hypothetical protein
MARRMYAPSTTITVANECSERVPSPVFYLYIVYQGVAPVIL